MSLTSNRAFMIVLVNHFMIFNYHDYWQFVIILCQIKILYASRFFLSRLLKMQCNVIFQWRKPDYNKNEVHFIMSRFQIGSKFFKDRLRFTNIRINAGMERRFEWSSFILNLIKSRNMCTLYALVVLMSVEEMLIAN